MTGIILVQHSDVPCVVQYFQGCIHTTMAILHSPWGTGKCFKTFHFAFRHTSTEEAIYRAHGNWSIEQPKMLHR